MGPVTRIRTQRGPGVHVGAGPGGAGGEDQELSGAGDEDQELGEASDEDQELSGVLGCTWGRWRGQEAQWSNKYEF